MAIYGQSEGSLIKGTVTLTADDATVTGSGTSFLTELTTGSELIFNQRAMIVKSIASATSLELTANWTAAGDQAIGFALEDGTLDTAETSTSDNESAEIGGSLQLDGVDIQGHIVEGDKMLNFQKNIILLDQIYSLAKEFKSTIVKNDNLDFIGDLLNEYWFLKKKLSTKVSNLKIDEIYNECISAGASGGKIIGSGGGGFLLIYCKKQFHNSLKIRLKKLPIVSFKFVEDGSKIIFNNKD